MKNMINKVVNKDCLEVLKEIEDESIDLVVTDPPYKIIAGGVRIIYEDDECGGVLNKKDYSKTDPKGCLNRGAKTVKVEASCKSEKMKKNVESWYSNKRIKKIVSDGSSIGDKWIKKTGSTPSAVKDGKMFEHNDIEFGEWLGEIYRVLKKGTHCYIMINARNLKELQIEAEKVGFKFQNLLVWNKGNATPNKYYMQSAEFILLLSKRPARNINDMGSKTVISNIPNEVGTKEHPTQKPSKLIDIFIKNSSNENDIVLDPFAGSGSTAVSAINNNRRFIATEIDDGYYELAKENIRRASGNVGLFTN